MFQLSILISPNGSVAYRTSKCNNINKLYI